MLTKLSTLDISQVASLHKKELPGFLSKLGVNFLEKFYRSSLKVPDIFTFVYKKDGKVVGFVSGVESTEGLLMKIIKKDPMGLLGSIIISCLKTPSLFFEIVKTLSYPGFSHNDAELLSIAVDDSHQSEGRIDNYARAREVAIN
jgi:ribosomal protein S18 acetylase RimI-like enzyme